MSMGVLCKRAGPLFVMGLVLSIQMPFSAGAITAQIKLSPKVAPPTLPFTVQGRGFGPSEVVAITFDLTLIGTEATGAMGSFSKRVAVPADALPGAHTVMATGQESGSMASAPFTVRTNWPRFHFDVGHTGFNPYENVLDVSNVPTLVQKWAVPTAAGGSPSPVVSGGTVYVAPAGGVVRALDPATGATIWSFDTGAAMSGAAPDVSAGILYVGDLSGALWAIRASTGAGLWRLDLGTSIPGSTVVANGYVYASVSDSALFAIEASNGAFAWRSATLSGSNPAVGNGIVYLVGQGLSPTQVLAWDAQTGEKIWVASPGCSEGCLAGPAAVADGEMFVAQNADLTAFDGATGDLVWDVFIAADVFTAPAAADGILYLTTSGVDDSVSARLEATGALMWTTPLPNGTAGSSPAVANGVLYTGAEDGSLHAYDIADGTELWASAASTSPVRGSPAVSDGVVYVGADDGTVYAYGLP
jgi:outer membrane protein assembly factor BamB